MLNTDKSDNESTVGTFCVLSLRMTPLENLVMQISQGQNKNTDINLMRLAWSQKEVVERLA